MSAASRHCLTSNLGVASTMAIPFRPCARRLLLFIAHLLHFFRAIPMKSSSNGENPLLQNGEAAQFYTGDTLPASNEIENKDISPQGNKTKRILNILSWNSIIHILAVSALAGGILPDPFCDDCWQKPALFWVLTHTSRLKREFTMDDVWTHDVSCTLREQDLEY